MIYKSNFSVGVAVANHGGAMEADTISNGRSSKSQMSKRNKLIPLIGKAQLIICFLAICLLSCSSPEEDGKKAAEKYCDCKIGYYEKFNEVFELYIKNYNSYSFETQSEAREKLSEYLGNLENEEENLNVCLKNASEFRSNLENQYFTSEDKKQKFQNTYNETENECIASPQNDAYNDYQERIETMIGEIPPLFKRIVGQWACNYVSRMTGQPYTRIIIFSPNGTVRDNYDEIIEQRYYDVEKTKNNAYQIVFFNLDRNKRRIHEERYHYDGGATFDYGGYGTFIRR